MINRNILARFTKNYFLILFSVLMVIRSAAQDREPSNNKEIKNIAFIKNQKLKYSIVLMACDTCVPIRNLGFRVVVEMSEQEMKIAQTIDGGTWLKLLLEKSSDFAANLILYQLFDKNAIPLLQIKNRELWVKYLRKEDISFWETLLIKNNSNYDSPNR
jgi:hypothetical protein